MGIQTRRDALQPVRVPIPSMICVLEDEDADGLSASLRMIMVNETRTG